MPAAAASRRIMKNQSCAILPLHKYFLANHAQMRYHDISKGAFESNKE